MTYHHGDLHAALLAAAEAILARDGPPALTLRATARAAGVSHAAPAHHFGDLTGLLSELAAIGFLRFADRLEQAAAAAPDLAAARAAAGLAYVGFARDHSALFLLMFRSERLDMQRPALCAASDRAFAALAGLLEPAPAALPPSVAPPRDTSGMPPGLVVRATATWALVHGLAMLLIDHRLDFLLAEWPGQDVATLLQAVLGADQAIQPPYLQNSPAPRS